MTFRTKFLITALVLCHHLLVPALVTSQLRSEGTQESAPSSSKNDSTPDLESACSPQAAQQDKDSTTICALQQDKIGDVYMLLGNA
jgi:hypothetical protein